MLQQMYLPMKSAIIADTMGRQKYKKRISKMCVMLKQVEKGLCQYALHMHSHICTHTQ